MTSPLTFDADELVDEKGLSKIASGCCLAPDALSRQLGIGIAQAQCIKEENKDDAWQHKLMLLNEWYKNSDKTEPTYGDLRKVVTTGFEVRPPLVSYDASEDGNTFGDAVKTLVNEHYVVKKISESQVKKIEGLEKKNDMLEKENEDLKLELKEETEKRKQAEINLNARKRQRPPRTTNGNRNMDQSGIENDPKQPKINDYFQPRQPLAEIHTNTTPY